MEIYLDMNSDIPIYQQIRNEIILGIAHGQLHVGEALPSTRQLAADFGINFHTVNKAYEMLRQEGVIVLNRKTGAVIFMEPMRSDFTEKWKENARVWLAEAFVKGMSPSEITRLCAAIVHEFKDKEQS